jgi:hypothetical protein
MFRQRKGKAMTTVVRKIKSAQPMGQYVATGLDAAKNAVQFLVIAVGSKNTIKWGDGRTEMVTDSKLTRLQATYSWATDF